MAKALIYSSIYDQTAYDFVSRVEEIASTEGKDLNVRINCNGGNPELGWGMICSYHEYEGEKSVKAEGKAYSMGLFFMVYTPKENTSCLDITQGLLHRAGYSEWFESSEYFTDALKTNLNNINAKLMEATRNRIDVKKLETIMDSKPETAGKKFKDIWSMDGRLDVFLTAKEMKEIGLVNKIDKITPKKIKSINAHVMECAAMYQGDHTSMLIPEVTAANTPQVEEPIINNTAMTAAEIKVKYPVAYNAIVSSGEQAGAKKETDRISAWMKFHQYDPKAVATAIENGDTIMDNHALIADLMIKMNNPDRGANPGASATDTNTDNDNPTPEGTLSEQEAAQAKVNELIGVGVKTEKTEK